VSAQQAEPAMTGVGLGKIILLGEHAVVYGYPALAAALDRGVAIAAARAPAGSGLRIELPAWNIAIGAEQDHPVARSLSAVAAALDAGRPDLVLLGEAQLPPGAGLGSSSALAVAVASALLAWLGRPGDRAAVLRAAGASEVVMHGTPSGIDVALAAAGGLGVFRRATGLAPVVGAPALRVLVALTGQGRSTAEMVARVAEATGGRADHAQLAALGALTETGIAALGAGDLPALGAAMNAAHQGLAGLGVSTPRLDALCDAARAAGAHGSKLTGAGGGGALLAIAPPGREPAVLAAWRRAGADAFAATLAAPEPHRPAIGAGAAR
jgi:mevalonate kinase